MSPFSLLPEDDRPRCAWRTFTGKCSNPKLCGNLSHRSQKLVFVAFWSGENPRRSLFLKPKPLVDAMIAQVSLEKYLCCGAYRPQAAIIGSGESEGKAEAILTYHIRGVKNSSARFDQRLIIHSRGGEGAHNLPGQKLIGFLGKILIWFAYPHRHDAIKPGGGA